VLLASDHSAKIADFGYYSDYETFDNSPDERHSRGTAIYMAPEMMAESSKNMTSQFLERTDIYSFGILMWEVFFGDIPYMKLFNNTPGLTLPRFNWLIKSCNVRPLIVDDVIERPTADAADAALYNVCTIMKRCWDPVLLLRPDSFEAIVTDLHSSASHPSNFTSTMFEEWKKTEKSVEEEVWRQAEKMIGKWKTEDAEAMEAAEAMEDAEAMEKDYGHYDLQVSRKGSGGQ
jgi:serine/threonine protein kinase